jgi:CBS domain-containing protein
LGHAPIEFSIVQELIYELTIEQVMTRDVISIAPNETMRDLKELLRAKRISGVPVVQNGDLVGVVSIERVIRSLEAGEQDTLVRDHMTGEPCVMRADETLIMAVNQFNRTGYGRFPVVDQDGALVGIITKGDIVRALVKQLEMRYHADEVERYRASHVFQDIESDNTSLILRYRIAPRDFVRGGEASSKIKKALTRLGADSRVVRRVAVAAYEAETNVMIHTKGGEMQAEVHPHRLVLTVEDSGPGIPDIEKAMKPGYSTCPDWIRELGFGAGMGLSNIKASTDEMKITSEVGVGTRLVLKFKLR